MNAEDYHIAALVVLCVFSFVFGDDIVETTEFCSFFNNRKPTPQPSLRNCTWFRGNSCCKQEEIDATFGTVKPLPGSSPDCQRFTNYLMCYVCAPYQNAFYSKEKLTMCDEFCIKWYEACSTAVLKGSVIGELYTNGRDFCKSRRFEVDGIVNGKCFIFDESLDKTSKGSHARAELSFCLPFFMFTVINVSSILNWSR